MIWGLQPASLYILAAMTSCPAHAPPVTEIAFHQSQVVFDNNSSTQSLSRQKVDTRVAHKANEVFTTGGITSGKIRAGFKISFRKLVYPATGEVCLWPDRVSVEVDYEPTVYIAREYRPASCRYETIAQHEMRHVNTDIITIKEYLAPLRQAVQQKINTVGTIHAPNGGSADQAQKEISGKIQEVVNSMMDDAERVRVNRQQQIDTRQEYLRISHACP